MKYEVKCDITKEVVSIHDTEQEAVSDAKTRENVHVIAHEQSGTYESHQQVWPVRGDCYTN